MGVVGEGEDPSTAAGSDNSRTSRPGGPGASAPLTWPVTYEGTPSSLRRLGRDELLATWQALTGSAPARNAIAAEPRKTRGQLLTGGLSYVQQEIQTYSNAAADFSARVAPEMLTRSGCRMSGQAQRDCLQTWSLGFAERALRRTARPDESAILQKILATTDGTSAADVTVVAEVLHAIFISPSFVYRFEVGTPLAKNPALRALSAAEIATRLSYLATLGPPDPDLLATMKAGGLSDGRKRAAELARLSNTDAGKHAMAVFVLEWLGANEPKIATKSAKYLSGLGAGFEQSIRASMEATISNVLSVPATATVSALLTTDSYARDPAILTVTKSAGSGLNATGDAPDTRRAGLLMHPQVLAAQTKEDGVSPFRLGAFIHDDMLCERIPPPPANAVAMAPSSVPAGLSLREQFQYKVKALPICEGCHGQFSSLGYAFLPFDPVGRWFKKDPSAKPWDLSGTIRTYSGDDLAFSSPRDLAEKLGGSPQVQGCFAQAALQWALGRPLVTEDEAIVADLNEVVKRSGGNVVSVFQTIVSAPEFANVVAAR